jgi:hypothetical protein
LQLNHFNMDFLSLDDKVFSECWTATVGHINRRWTTQKRSERSFCVFDCEITMNLVSCKMQLSYDKA